MSGQEDELAKILENRGSQYGPFATQARLTQDLERVVRPALEQSVNMNLGGSLHDDFHPGDAIMEGVHMILHKLARIANGDPCHEDSWNDIAGYATVTLRAIREHKARISPKLSLDDIPF